MVKRCAIWVSHIAGAVLGVVALVWCLILADNPMEIVTSIVYSMTMILLYTTSSIYHGLTHPMAKRVFQVLDHCTIYLYIAGTYTIIALCSLRLESATMAWVLFAIEWVTAAIAVTLTAIDIKRYEHFSLACYIVMGWSAIIAVKPIVRAGLGRFLAAPGRRHIVYYRLDPLCDRQEEAVRPFGFSRIRSAGQPLSILLHSLLCPVT